MTIRLCSLGLFVVLLAGWELFCRVTKISELIASYQTQEAATKNLNEAKEVVRAQKQAHTEFLEQQQARLAESASLIESVEKIILEDYQKINWDSLRNDDPAEWSAKKQEFEERQNHVNSLKQKAVDSWNDLQKQSAGGYRWRLNLDAIEANYDSLRDQPTSSQPFVKPTLFIKGADSNYIQAQHEEEIKALFPDAKVKIVMGAGHWVHAEKPQAVQKIVSDFLLNDQ